MPARLDARPCDDQRHANLLLVNRRAMVAPPVLAELLAMVSGDEEHRPWALRFHEIDDPPDALVGGGDFTIVGIDVGRETPANEWSACAT